MATGGPVSCEGTEVPAAGAAGPSPWKALATSLEEVFRAPGLAAALGGRPVRDLLGAGWVFSSVHLQGDPPLPDASPEYRLVPFGDRGLDLIVLRRRA